MLQRHIRNGQVGGRQTGSSSLLMFCRAIAISQRARGQRAYIGRGRKNEGQRGGSERFVNRGSRRPTSGRSVPAIRLSSRFRHNTDDDDRHADRPEGRGRDRQAPRLLSGSPCSPQSICFRRLTACTVQRSTDNTTNAAHHRSVQLAACRHRQPLKPLSAAVHKDFNRY